MSPRRNTCRLLNRVARRSHGCLNFLKRYPVRNRIWPATLSLALFVAAALLCVAPALAQFDDKPDPSAGKNGPKIDESLTKKIKIGVKVKAVGGPVKGVRATIPVPIV